MDVLYSFFSDRLTEFFDEEFADSAYTALKIFASMLAVSAIIAVIYYKVIDSAAFNKPSHWLLTLLVVVIISGVCGYLIISGDYSTYKEDNQDSDIIVSTIDCVLVGVMNVIYSAIVYFVFSILIKGFSHNCRVTPTKRFNLFR